MKRILFLFLVLSLMLTIVGCTNHYGKILNADFEVVDNGGSHIEIRDKSTSDFNQVDYTWTLELIDENGKVIYDENFLEVRESFSFPKPNTKKAELRLHLLGDDGKQSNVSTMEKSIPTDHIPIVLDRESGFLTAYFKNGADRWVIMEDQNGNVVKEKNLNRKVDNVLFDLATVNANSVIIKAYDGDWFLNQIEYDLDSTENRAPQLHSIGNKTVTEGNNLNFEVTASDPDGDSVNLSVTNMPQGASFDESSGEFNWNPDSGDAGNYDVTFKVSDGEYTDSETINIEVQEESNGDVSFSYHRISEGKYEFTASQPDNAKFWEWKFPDNEYPHGYEENAVTHSFDNNLIGQTVTIRLEVYETSDPAEEPIGTYEETFILE